MTSTSVLVNCTGRDVKILVDGELQLLPAGPTPSIVEDTTSSREVLVSTGEGLPGASITVGVATPSMTLFMPEPLPGVLYLVRPEVLLRHPHREDLLTPAFYTTHGPARQGQMYLVGAFSAMELLGEAVSNVSGEDFAAAGGA